MSCRTPSSWKTLRAAAFAAVAALAGACSTAPTYVPASGEVTVPVRFMGMGRPQMCVDGRVLALDVDKGGVARVPASRAVTLGAYIYVENYNISSDCSPWVSFVPQAGAGYVANAGLGEAHRCYVELVRADPARETGVAPEPSLRPGRCPAPTP